MDGKVKLYQISGKKVLQSLTHSSEDLSSSVGIESGVGTEFVSGDMDVGDPGGIIVAAGGILSVECVGFSVLADFKWVASGGMDRTVKVWDVVTGACRSVCTHGGSVVALRWHCSLPLIATAALDNIVRLWDARSSTCVLELTGHSDLVLDLQMSPLTEAHGQGNQSTPTDSIISVSDDRTARAFHICAPMLMS